MAGRTHAQDLYRFGFNGKENDGETGTQDYGMRIYNPALGKFLSVDPLTKDYPWYTPYQFAGNAPINCIDLDGAEQFPKTVEDIINAADNFLSTAQDAYDMVKKAGSIAMDAINFANYASKLKFYARVEGKITIGGRAALEVKRNAGVDLNATSVDLISFYAEFNVTNMKFEGKINYLNKDGEVIMSQGISGSTPVGVIENAVITVGGGIKSETSIKNGKQNTTVTVEKGGGAAIVTPAGIIPISVTSKTTKGKDSNGTEFVQEDINAGAEIAVGVGVVVEASVKVGTRVKTDKE